MVIFQCRTARRCAAAHPRTSACRSLLPARRARPARSVSTNSSATGPAGSSTASAARRSDRRATSSSAACRTFVTAAESRGMAALSPSRAARISAPKLVKPLAGHRGHGRRRQLTLGVVPRGGQIGLVRDHEAADLRCVAEQVEIGALRAAVTHRARPAPGRRSSRRGAPAQRLRSPPRPSVSRDPAVSINSSLQAVDVGTLRHKIPRRPRNGRDDRTAGPAAAR